MILCNHCKAPVNMKKMQEVFFQCCSKCQLKVDKAIRTMGWQPGKETFTGEKDGLKFLRGKKGKFKNLGKFVGIDINHPQWRKDDI